MLAIFFTQNVVSQSSWKSFENIPIQDSINVDLVWEHNNKLWLYTSQKDFSLLNSIERVKNHVIPFHGESLEAPEARKQAVQWSKGNDLWLFGGLSLITNSLLNDMWVYHINSNTWDLIKRDVNEVPSSRRGAVGWAGKSNELWMFGGMTEVTALKSDELSDELWYFDLKSEKWNLKKIDGGPTPRVNMAKWELKSSQVLVYGGFGYSSDKSTFGGLSDLWEFDVSKERWTRLDNEKSPYDKVYGRAKVDNIVSHPGNRINPVFWTDNQGYCWLTLGQSIVSQNLISVESDLWRLNPKTFEWTYFPQETKEYITEALAVMQNSLGETIMLFPTVVNSKVKENRKTSLNLLEKHN